jgi:hypothetical protein
MALLFGIAALAIFLFAMRAFVRADPRRLAQRLYLSGGVVAIVVGILLTLTGRAGIGASLVAVGIPLLVRGSTPLADDLHGGDARGGEHAERDLHSRRRNPPRQGAMTEEEAYEILGLDAGAGAEEIRRAHRALMKKVHPDQGGSSYLASRVNQAKDLLLRTHH